MKKHDISSLDELCILSKNNLEWFWESVDKDIGIVWDKPYTKTLDTSNGIPWSKWFIDGKTNIYKSSVEKFTKITPEKIAYNFISEDGLETKLSYCQLNSKVSQMANGLKSLGVKKGDVIAEIANYPENGNWATHLHFQIMLSMLDYETDYPRGVFL